MDTRTLDELITDHQEMIARIRAEEAEQKQRAMEAKRQVVISEFFEVVQPIRHLLSFRDDDVSVSGLTSNEKSWAVIEWYQTIRGSDYLLRMEYCRGHLQIFSPNQRYRGGGYVKADLYAGQKTYLEIVDRLVEFAAKVSEIGILSSSQDAG